MGCAMNDFSDFIERAVYLIFLVILLTFLIGV